jgi:hypothetical protein
MTPRLCPVRDEKGMALPLALMVLLLLSGLCLSFLSMSGYEAVIAQNHDAASKAFHIADAGIEHARAVLPGIDFAAVLQAGGNLFNALAFGSGTYTVNLVENPDGTYFLLSTGLYKNASRTIRALVTAAGLPAPLAAVEILTDGVISEIVAEGVSYDGRDWNAPADIAACTNIVGCGTLLDPNTNAITHGVFRNKANGTLYVDPDGADGGSVYGTNCTSGSCANNTATASIKTDTSVPTTRWDKFLDAAVPKADRTETHNGTISGTHAWGTPEAPEITVLKTNGALSWPATVNGAGVLIIESVGGNVAFTSSGQLNWHGLVIIRSPGSVNFRAGSRPQTARIFGQFVNRSATSAGVNLEYSPNAIKYSSAAMSMVRQQFLSVQGWQEVTL